jgi:hypothetical protein
MSRLSRSRVAVATGLTLGTATAGLLFAPAAFAAGTPEAVEADASGTVSAPANVVVGEKFTVTGTDCRYHSDGADTQNAPVAILATDSESENYEDVVFYADPNPAGDWSTEILFPAGTPTGAHEVSVQCNKSYNGETLFRTEYYQVVTVNVTAPAANTGTTTPAPSGTAAPSSSAAAEFTPGATPNTPGTGSVTSSKTTKGNAAAPGQQVVKMVKGFKDGEKVKLVLHSDPITLGTFSEVDGVVTATFTIPANAPLGNHTLVYEGDQGTHFEEPLAITKDGKALAYTGADIKMPLIGGTVLLAAGAGALFVGRRRRTGAAQA